MARVLREPLLHFLVLGLLLFVGYRFVSQGRDAERGQIVVTQERIAAMREQFERAWQRTPTAQELDGLVLGYIREEVLYREGVALGLDRDDPVIRNRVRARMEVLSEGADVKEPTEAELQAWLDSHRSDFEIAPTFTFRQVYFDPKRHGSRMQRDAEAVLTTLRRSDPDAVAFHLGDVTLLPSAMSEATAGQIADTFGKDFASAMPGLSINAWSGPLQSAYGLHLVQLVRRTEARTPALAEVRERVQRDWTSANTREASVRHYDELRRRYTVVIEPPAAERVSAASR
jgi:hypothetical protein